LSRSSSGPGHIRDVPKSSISVDGVTVHLSDMDSSLEGRLCPPLGPNEVSCSLQSSEGQIIKPEIFGRIDKGFFLADNDWTCYRRNYFSLNCSYTLQPMNPNGSVYLRQANGSPGPQVYSFAMSIAAVVDGRDGKSIELVRHTPKRDKGPQEKPARIVLQPRLAYPTHGMYSGESNQNSNQPQREATFERIQFKHTTANNGKKRAAQQYYYLLVELFADTGPERPERWVKIASRMSAPLVVRGRSPGHYQTERGGSNASSGPGGSGSAAEGENKRKGYRISKGKAEQVESSYYDGEEDDDEKNVMMDVY
jgi:meiosis-specific transcription factor NDT80